MTQPPGVPNWVDLGTPDLEGAKRFYAELLGWVPNVSPDPQYGGYTIFTKDGRSVAGAGTLFTPEQPPAWSTYVATDDAEEVARRVDAHGGKVLMAPFDVPEQGRMGVFTDPAGAPFGVWQGDAMSGAELFNEPGSLTWNELTTRDPDGAKAFYGAVFGWTPDDTPFGPVTYTTWRLGDRPIGGMMPMVGDDWPADLPAHWMAYFAVADTDATAAHAVELGGTISVPATNIPQGRFAVLTDPQGATFSVIAMT